MTNQPPPQTNPPPTNDNTPPANNPPTPKPPPVPADPGGGGGDGGGDGDGDGEGDCDPETEECGEGGTGSAKSGCGTEPDCSDTTHIQCAILRQVWQSNCDTYAFASDFDATAGAAQLLASSGLSGSGISALSGEEEAALELITDEVNLMDWVNEFLPQTSDAACPAPLTASALGQTITFDLEMICDFLRIMSVFVVIASTLLAFRIGFTST